MSKELKNCNNQACENKNTELTEEMLTEVSGGFAPDFLSKHCLDCIYYVATANADKKCKLGLKGGGDICGKHTVAM